MYVSHCTKYQSELCTTTIHSSVQTRKFPIKDQILFIIAAGISLFVVYEIEEI